MSVSDAEAVCVVDAKNLIGEGALWDSDQQCLWWVDVPLPSRLYRYEPATKVVDEWPMPEMITSLALRASGSGLLVASHGGINTFDPEVGELVRVATPEPHKPFNRCNDGGVDANGNFWFGTLQNNIAPNGDPIAIVESSGDLYRLAPDLTLTKFDEGFAVTNTMCWSPDNTRFYTCDSLKQEIYQYDYDAASSAISGRRVLTAYDKGVPDGSAVDEEGYLWNARWGGGCVARISPSGDLDRLIDIPCENVTSCAFGGPAHDYLYVTTARYALASESLHAQPQSGGVFAVRPGVRGLPVNRFGG